MAPRHRIRRATRDAAVIGSPTPSGRSRSRTSPPAARGASTSATSAPARSRARRCTGWPVSARSRQRGCSRWPRAPSGRCSPAAAGRESPRCGRGRRRRAQLVAVPRRCGGGAASHPRSAHCSSRTRRVPPSSSAGWSSEAVGETRSGASWPTRRWSRCSAALGRRGALAGAAVLVPILVERLAGNAPAHDRSVYLARLIVTTRERSRRPVPAERRHPAASAPARAPSARSRNMTLVDGVRKRGFRTLLWGQGVSTLGDWMGAVAFMVVVLELSELVDAVARDPRPCVSLPAVAGRSARGPQAAGRCRPAHDDARRWTSCAP